MKPDESALVLGILARQPAHGYAIAQEIKRQSDGMLKMGEGKLYPLLRLMEEEGLIHGDWQDAPVEGRPRRRIYAPTPKGMKRLSTARTQWVKASRMIGDILAPSKEANDNA